MVNAEEILPEAEEHRTKWKDYVRDAADIFHNKEGELFERDTAIEKLTEELDIEEDTAQQTLSALVSDIVDPVVQVPSHSNKYVGVVEYHEYDGAYGYREFDDVNGEANRVVCARCVETASGDKEVTHATSGSGSFDEDADFDELYDAIVEHYDQSHDLMPESVETGASLLSGTTIGGNTAFHGGNSHGNSSHDSDYTTLTEVNNNADVPNADYADSAGNADNADTVGGLQPGEVEHYSTESNISVDAGQFAVADDTGSLYFEDGN